jgi:hypothetical protein
MFIILMMLMTIILMDDMFYVLHLKFVYDSSIF